MAVTRKSWERFWMGGILLGLLTPGILWAVRPIWAPYALAAGSGIEGYQDGSFTQARFRKPMGMAISPDAHSLYVADSGNNCVRVIHLDDKNRVSTLAGSVKPGKTDGAAAAAGFKDPRFLALVPGNLLLVNDLGNKLLRSVDIDKGTVQTLSSGQATTLEVGPVSQVTVDGLQQMIYSPEADSVFLSFPDRHSVRRLDLKTGLVSVAAGLEQGLSHPFSLAVSGKILYVGDKDTPGLTAFTWDGKGLSAPVSQTSKGALVAMGQGACLYGLNGGSDPLVRLLPVQESVPFMSLEGDDVPGDFLLALYNENMDAPSGMVADPMDGRKLYLSNPALHQVFSIRDTYRNFAYAGSNVSLLEPSPQKDPRVYRILFVGDSRATMISPYPFKPSYDVGSRTVYPVQAGTTKRMEQELNLQASLQDAPYDFEATSLTQSASEPLFLWPTYWVPKVAREQAVDLVILLEPPTVETVFPYKFYFMNPITPEGIPQYPNDPEYLVKPPAQRIPEGAPKRFYEICKKHGEVRVEGSNFVFDQKLFQDPDLHDLLIELYGRPLELLKNKLAAMKNVRGEPVRLLVCTSHSYLVKPNLEPPDIWNAICQKYQVPLLDLNDAMSACMVSYYPIAESGGNDHFNTEGHAFFGRFLADELIRKGLVPWTKGAEK